MGERNYSIDLGEPFDSIGENDGPKETAELRRHWDFSDEDLDNAETYLWNAINAITHAQYGMNEEGNILDAMNELEGAWWILRNELDERE